MSDDLLELESVAEPMKEDPAGPPAPDPPLELAEIEPLPEPTFGPPPPRRRLPRWPFVLLGLAAAGGVAFYASPFGRPRLPEVVKSEAAKLARELEPTFYVFTDDEGVPHIVDDLAKVPPRYRARAEKKR